MSSKNSTFYSLVLILVNIFTFACLMWNYTARRPPCVEHLDTQYGSYYCYRVNDHHGPHLSGSSVWDQD
jgi:hypothetical protein